MGATAIRILGIDPGLRNMGWGIIEAAGSRLIYVASGIDPFQRQRRSRHAAAPAA